MKKRPNDTTVAKHPGLRVIYRPANTSRDLPAGSPHKAMDAFLLSSRVQDVSLEAAKDIASAASDIAIAEGRTATGSYARSFKTEAIEPVLVAGNLRRAAAVYNDDRAAAPVEFGNRRVGAGRYVLFRAGQLYHTPRTGRA